MVSFFGLFQSAYGIHTGPDHNHIADVGAHEDYVYFVSEINGEIFLRVSEDGGNTFLFASLDNGNTFSDIWNISNNPDMPSSHPKIMPCPYSRFLEFDLSIKNACVIWLEQRTEKPDWYFSHHNEGEDESDNVPGHVHEDSKYYTEVIFSLIDFSWCGDSKDICIKQSNTHIMNSILESEDNDAGIFDFDDGAPSFGISNGVLHVSWSTCYDIVTTESTNEGVSFEKLREIDAHSEDKDDHTSESNVLIIGNDVYAFAAQQGCDFSDVNPILMSNVKANEEFSATCFADNRERPSFNLSIDGLELESVIPIKQIGTSWTRSFGFDLMPDAGDIVVKRVELTEFNPGPNSETDVPTSNHSTKLLGTGFESQIIANPNFWNVFWITFDEHLVYSQAPIGAETEFSEPINLVSAGSNTKLSGTSFDQDLHLVWEHTNQFEGCNGILYLNSKDEGNTFSSPKFVFGGCDLLVFPTNQFEIGWCPSSDNSICGYNQQDLEKLNEITYDVNWNEVCSECYTFSKDGTSSINQAIELKNNPKKVGMENELKHNLEKGFENLSKLMTEIEHKEQLNRKIALFQESYKLIIDLDLDGIPNSIDPFQLNYNKINDNYKLGDSIEVSGTISSINPSQMFTSIKKLNDSFFQTYPILIDEKGNFNHKINLTEKFSEGWYAISIKYSGHESSQKTFVGSSDKMEQKLCKDDFVAITKISNNSLVCVKQFTAAKLIDRGYGQI